jgi:hypothetical protein
MSSDVRNWTLYDIKNWTPFKLLPRDSELGGLSR